MEQAGIELLDDRPEVAAGGLTALVVLASVGTAMTVTSTPPASHPSGSGQRAGGREPDDTHGQRTPKGSPTAARRGDTFGGDENRPATQADDGPMWRRSGDALAERVEPVDSLGANCLLVVGEGHRVRSGVEPAAEAVTCYRGG